MYIFYINGFLRNPWIGFTAYYDTWYMNIALCFIFVIVTLVMSYIMIRFANILSSKLRFLREKLKSKKNN